MQRLPHVGEAGADGEVTANGARRAGFFAERIERGAAEVDDHRVGGLDRELLARHADQHLAPARLFWLLVAGAGDVGGTECLSGLVQVNAESGEGPGRGGIGIAEGGEQQMVRADRLRPGQPGGCRRPA
jgi:hypothetical protein